jgi:zinc protease
LTGLNDGCINLFKKGSMMFKYVVLLACLIPVIRVQGNYADHKEDTIRQPAGIHPADTLPFDPAVRKGKLGNGLTYYVRENHKPENRAQIWLAVNAGSVLEDDDQLGLAHFLEHMAFNGTEDFAKHEIIDYLESIGMKFGPEINAYTGFDETVYMLQLPTDSAEILDTGMEILFQWAHKIKFEKEEIEKERGVVIEEWRLGRGAQMRMLDKQLPVLLKGSRYKDRLPIGTRKNLENFNPESLKRFYREWYRPDLMAVIAVGDFHAGNMLALINEKFSGWACPEDPRPRPVFAVPDHAETLYAIATDPEAPGTSVSVYYKGEVLPEVTANDYRRMLIEQLFSRMMNIRFYERLNQAEPPYLFSYMSRSSIVRSKAGLALNVGVKESGIIPGLEAALTETMRVQQHGFTASELERTKTWLIRRFETAYQERDKTESSDLASEYLRNFLEQEPVPGISYEYRIAQAMVPEITLDEVNRLAGKWITEGNRVVLLNAPEKDDLEIPDERALANVFTSVDSRTILPYIDETSGEPLLARPDSKARIASEEYLSEINLTTWELSNGVRIMLKPTDFKNDEILFQAISPGGTSLVTDGEFRSSRAASDIVSLSGVGNFDLNSLNKKLTGKEVTVFPYINELSEGLVGNASPKDLETMFQLIHLYITHPRKDSSAFLSYKARMQGFIENRSGDPESAYQDTIMVTMANHHFRRRPWSLEMLDDIDPDDSYRIYKNRFSDAGDFTFIFVGNFNVDSIRTLILAYLGSLPSGGREETWKDIDVNSPRGIIKKTVFRGMEPKSRVSLNFTGDFEWTRENSYALSSMGSVLRIRLREILREDLSGTYGTSVSATSSQQPRETYRITISFGCDPDRTGELTETVFAVIDSLKKEPVDPEYITKVTETQKRTYETRIEENRFWLTTLSRYIFRGMDPLLILDYPELVKTLTPQLIMDAARNYLNASNYVQVVLKPQAEAN